MTVVSTVERTEGEIRRRLDDGFRLAVQPKLATVTVPRSQLLAGDRKGTPRAVPYEHRVGASSDEDPESE